MTDVAVLQCVERGLLELDADVQITVPEITKYGIITGWDEEKNVAILSPARNKITMRYDENSTACNASTFRFEVDIERLLIRSILRHLITGSSGHCYEVIHPLLTKWRLSRNEAFFGGDTIEEKCTIPLVFEPGTAWAYGGGWDWAGKIVEKVTHKTLEEYMRENIWEPLGLKDCTFWPEKRSDFKDRRVRMSVLDRKSQKSFPGEFDLTGAAKDCTGGGGVYATPEDYLQFLLAVLRQDERLVKRASFAEMFRPQLSETAAGAFKAMFDHVPEAQGYYACNVPAGTPKDYSLGGLFVKEDVPGWMKKETILWSGLPCLLWVSIYVSSDVRATDLWNSSLIPKQDCVGLLLAK